MIHFAYTIKYCDSRIPYLDTLVGTEQKALKKAEEEEVKKKVEEEELENHKEVQCQVHVDLVK